MKKKIDIKNIRGKIIFSFEKEDNTLKDTVEEAVRQRVSLKYANLRYTNLHGADLRGADLFGADLRGANLSCADLDKAILKGAILNEAVLRDTNLRGANLRYATLNDADLEGANLEGTDIYNIDFSMSKNVPDLPLACPSEGEFIAWKKIRHYKEKYKGEFLVKLLIPEDAKRSSATTKKCRCSKAKVLEIKNVDTGKSVKKITNTNMHPITKYEVGKTVYPNTFDENRWFECSNGIHFFMDRQDAVVY